jgi:hypothetical protein
MTADLAEGCAKAVHVLRPDGEVLRAGRACLFVLEQTGWGTAARLLSLPPSIWAVELGYSIVARHRSFFARFLFTRE